MIVLGMVFITVNDSLIKALGGDYPLHQMVFIRSAIGICFSLVILQFEGGFGALRTATPGLHLLRGLLVVISNMLYFAALAVMPLADAVATFFVAPLIITVFSVVLLGERVGLHRVGAIVVGFLGVLVMTRPGTGGDAVARGTILLPILAATAYAGMQVMTRKLGVYSKASALAVYIQAVFLCVSVGFFLVAGDGRYAEGVESDSLVFLLRAWVWPAPEDWPLFIALGVVSGAVGYLLSASYKMGNAATVSSFEYTALPMAILSGWLVFGEVPDLWVLAGTTLIAGAGIHVFMRERRRRSPVAPRRPLRRV
ncbi:DMT family transporter [Nioella nitratireducens]|uniref:DMT family transporter n=1 Tax=Nioella nitratireducens TaxID=1287720 RepID=UPI002D218458|nr:DMT family transporter [Nioella nitratireducens]